jgi:hypothetical protein
LAEANDFHLPFFYANLLRTSKALSIAGSVVFSAVKVLITNELHFKVLNEAAQ